MADVKSELDARSAGEHGDEFEKANLLETSGIQAPFRRRDPRSRPWIVHGLLCLTFFFSCAASFFAGTLFSHASSPSDTLLQADAHPSAMPRVPVGTEIKSFHMNDSFAQLPEPGQPEAAWDSLLPNGLGYVQHATLAPEFSVVSVFHQLHCLYTLRRAFYAPGAAPADFDFGHDRPRHAAHCFEYLRQALLCAADSSVEPASRDARAGHEFLGWDSPRQCRDYGALRGWAEENRVFDAHGFLAKDLKHG